MALAVASGAAARGVAVDGRGSCRMSRSSAPASGIAPGIRGAVRPAWLPAGIVRPAAAQRMALRPLGALADRPASTPSSATKKSVPKLEASNVVIKEISNYTDSDAARAAAEEKMMRTKEKFAKKAADKQRQRVTYLLSAIAASSGIGGLALWATYSRFAIHGDETTSILPEMLATLSLAAGAAFGMEMFARWAHKDLWHDGWWNLSDFGFGEDAPWVKGHESHHIPREGAFEANDIFAIINAAPAIGLILYGFLTPGIVGGCSFGLGLGITAFGWAYMFVHDGLIHRRFPVGPIADVPYLKRIAAAHQLHHAEKFDGAPWGLFLGEQELELIGPHAVEELDRLVEARDKAAEAERLASSL